MSNSLIKRLLLCLSFLVAACADAPEYRLGIDTTTIEFEFFDETEGIYPSLVVLDDPNNPFTEYAISSDSKFALFEDASNAGAFYASATSLAYVPIGENQYFAALALQLIYENEEVAREDRDKVKQMAIDGFQSVLDNFPESVLFLDATATDFVRLATLSYVGIEELGGIVQGDWVLVTTESGQQEAIQSTNTFRGAN